MLNILAAFRINNREIKKLFFLVNNLIILLLYFNIEIFKIINNNIINYFCLIIYRELKNLIIFLEYNFIAFYLD